MCEAPFAVTILFIPVSAPLDKLATDWAEDCDKIVLRLCPICKRDSIVGHGRRRKQAHDEHHDWIGIHRGRCAGCVPRFRLCPDRICILGKCNLYFRPECLGLAGTSSLYETYVTLDYR